MCFFPDQLNKCQPGSRCICRWTLQWRWAPLPVWQGPHTGLGKGKDQRSILVPRSPWPECCRNSLEAETETGKGAGGREHCQKNEAKTKFNWGYINRVYLLFVCSNQLLVLSVLQLPRSLSNRQRSVEHKQLARTVCSLQGEALGQTRIVYRTNADS